MSTPSASNPVPEPCQQCGHENTAGSAFCANCGAALHDPGPPSPDRERMPGENSETTVAYVPVTDAAPPAQQSPWARPRPGEETDPGRTTSFPVPDAAPVYDEDPEPVPPPFAPEESLRGFVLGLIGLGLIGALLAVYVYNAWLGEAARDTVDSWLPWLE